MSAAEPGSGTGAWMVRVSAPAKASETWPVCRKIANCCWYDVVKFETKLAFHRLKPSLVIPLMFQVADELQQPPVPLLVFRKVNGEPPGSGGTVLAVSVQVCPGAAAATLGEQLAGFPEPAGMKFASSEGKL